MVESLKIVTDDGIETVRMQGLSMYSCMHETASPACHCTR